MKPIKAYLDDIPVHAYTERPIIGCTPLDVNIRYADLIAQGKMVRYRPVVGSVIIPCGNEWCKKMMWIGPSQQKLLTTQKMEAMCQYCVQQLADTLKEAVPVLSLTAGEQSRCL